MLLEKNNQLWVGNTSQYPNVAYFPVTACPEGLYSSYTITICQR